MSPTEAKDKINQMDQFDKLKVYMYYFIANISLKYQLQLQGVNAIDPNMYSFEEFTDPANKGYYNNQSDWRHDNGIYDFYWKFADKIKL